MAMGIVLKGFQEHLLNQVRDAFNKNQEVCLASSTGSGKTEMAIAQVREWVSKGKRVVILAHGQTTIRQNFSDRLTSRGVTHLHVQSSKDIEGMDSSSVSVCLPQNIVGHLQSLNQFDFMVVDEAHQFYGKDKKMYSNILKWHQAASGKVWLLTSSHYNLRCPKVFFSREEALDAKQISDFTFENIKVDEKIVESSLQDDELKKSVNLTAATEEMIGSLYRPEVRTMITVHNTGFADRITNFLSEKFSRPSSSINYLHGRRL